MLGTSPILEKPAASSPKTGDKLLMNQDNAVKQIDYDALATAILNKLSSQNFSSLSTSAKTVLGAVNELNSNRLCLNRNYAESIPDNDDLNDYLNAGNYYSENSVVSSSIKHSPYSNEGFALYVIQQGTTRKQIAIPTVSNEISIRTYTGSDFNDSWKVIS